ncbi:ATPase [Aneurinibacillus migulanus]|uniref:AAA domain (Dynein-related subfamily) n=1 Tax=Aneurinibacillus migulanus TaxID=47500 RepID=A0A0D1W4U6_ANEMI|nr:MoxR family ATPase [Aneurinibacillus migulanus]KIV53365.1 ATPase [Aneurinibacillus migulanus]KIV57927.1 ATPase [Aneurinibacillus migulanus]KON97309.1 ATPase [Aneurinibacillus migulanus]KPD10136.1 ATPase [Aneurinibacillus migulanus]MCP1357610.1 MoxR family ATPase [Aneurinibacillus migulanus]
MRRIETNIMSIEQAFREQGYVTDRSTATALHLVKALKKPLLVEGPAGVGKTEIAKVLARVLDTRLIRLQCYEGLDVNTALYEWNYQKQLLHLKLTEQSKMTPAEREAEIFSSDFLLRRPLLEAISDADASPVLLIDEVDRADEEFEAFLLELLAEFQITVPELGTLRAKHRPYVILTSNRTRDLSEALRRRCLYHWISYPEPEKEKEILASRLPGIDTRLAGQIVSIMERIRRMPLDKIPGVAESLDWAHALTVLHQGELNVQTVKETLGCIAKDLEDWKQIEQALEEGWMSGNV